MAGHSHWKQIKVQKGSADQKRGRLFSKLLKAVSIAARHEPNPQFNPRLRAAVLKAKEGQVPQDNIERAINKASSDKELEELVVEAYGPAGVAILIEAASDSSNRTVNELRLILKDNGGKFAEPGSVRWAFEAPSSNQFDWKPKFNQEMNKDDEKKLADLVSALENHDDVQKVYTNADQKIN